ncbi:MAG TPA: ABC transporter substrate-binding protein [Geobacteraceae bacterium]|nr:ABC transporter substrate-binding protein [Geobacteraceae bacterium]
MEYLKKLRFFTVIAGSVLFACMFFLPATGGAEQKGAEDSVRKMNSALMECMKKGGELGFRGRYKLLDPVIRDVFALRFMGEVAMGSFWKNLSPEQKKLYMEVYTEWTISSYAGNFDSYSGESFKIKEGQESKGSTVTVISDLVRPHDESIVFNYSLRRVQDKWRIVDIRIEGVSQLAMTRSQFVTVMKQKGFDGLIASLKEKAAALRNKESE